MTQPKPETHLSEPAVIPEGKRTGKQEGDGPNYRDGRRLLTQAQLMTGLRGARTQTM